MRGKGQGRKRVLRWDRRESSPPGWAGLVGSGSTGGRGETGSEAAQVPLRTGQLMEDCRLQTGLTRCGLDADSPANHAKEQEALSPVSGSLGPQ